MDDLVRWLGEQFDADERIARAAQQNGDVKDGHWFDDEDEEVIDDSGWRIAFTVDTGTRAHIAAHDPARVLREIDAKRALMKQIFRYEAKIDGEWGCCHDAKEIEAGECPETPPHEIEALQILALVYADRPGYQESWRP
ncbi:DUF6221 family protein [Streptomyces murinus]|uniref:DUF6221 family protein n=1 Tax=Streptomyces murinus TaxID=33900 RepID=UPI0018F56294|nr:DUF6221 family protein [Streptomyces murinus]